MAYVTVCILDGAGGDQIRVGVSGHEKYGYCIVPVGCYAFDTKAEAYNAGRWFLQTHSFSNEYVELSNGFNPDPRFEIMTIEEFTQSEGNVYR